MLHCKVELPRKLYKIDVELSLRDGECLCLFGPSAAGKTSILSTIAGFEPRARAHITWGDEVIADGASHKRHTLPPWRRRFAYVTQHSSLFPHLSVRDNLIYGVTGHTRWTDEAEQMAERFGLVPYLKVRPGQLSGGLAQRVNLARALLARPRLLLLDEPLSALDADVRRAMQDLIHEARQSLCITTLLVTHQLSEAQRLADRIALLDHGRLIQTGTPADLMQAPQNETAARLMGYTQFLPEKLVDPNGEAGLLAIHPDRTQIGEHYANGPVVFGRITRITPYHGAYRATVALAAGPVIDSALPAFTTHKVEDEVAVTLLAPVRVSKG